MSRLPRGDAPVLAAFALGLAFVTAAIVFGGINAFHTRTMTCTVTDKDRTTKVVDGNSSSDARVYTSDCGTLSVGDSWLSWTFSSADTYAEIEEGETYEFTTRGFRVPFFSMFPNIVEVEK